MKITGISSQAKNPDRVNVSVDGTYRFSLDIFQVGSLGIKVDKEYSEDELRELEAESSFGKLYTRALEYTMLRPHSGKEIKDYLWKKTRTTKYRSRSGEIKEREGVSQDVVDRVFARLTEKGYINDESFTRFWVENRNQAKGTSKRKLQAELRTKGVESSLIDQALSNSERTDEDELSKIIAKKRRRYDDDQKFMAYLARQGFSYDNIRKGLSEASED